MDSKPKAAGGGSPPKAVHPRHEFSHGLSHGLSHGNFELELIRSQMTQKPMVRGEVGARAWRVCVQTRAEAWASA